MERSDQPQKAEAAATGLARPLVPFAAISSTAWHL